MPTEFKRTPQLRFFAFATAALVLSGVAARQVVAQVQDNTAPLAIGPSPGVDEDLFLVRLAADIYNNLPDSRKTAPQDLMDALERSKNEAIAVRGLIRARGLEPKVGMLYDDLIESLSAYQTFLANRGAIEKRSNQQSLSDILGSIFQGIHEGSEVSDDAAKLGASKDDADSAGEIAGWIKGLYVMYSKNQQNDAATEAAIDAELHKLNDIWQTNAATDTQIVQDLARARGWQPGEAGFDGFQSNNLYDYVKRRPRDAFLLDQYANATSESETPGDLVTRASLCIEAAELIPAGTVYDDFRIKYVGDATLLELQASTLESSGNYSSGITPSGPRALQLARTYLALDPDDTSGFGRAQLARALGFCGLYREAIEAANTAAASPNYGTSDPGFCYRYARLESLTGSLDLVDQWLTQAYARGFHDIQFVRNDPDLANFRRARPGRFAELTTIRLRQPELQQAILLHDVVLHNDSPFELTNVRVRLVVRKDGQDLSPADIQCKSIAAGGTCRQDNAVSFFGNQYESLRATYDCDQVPR